MYFMFMHAYMLYSYTFTYISFDPCITINHEKWHIYLEMDTKWQRKELFKLWIQRKATSATTRMNTFKIVIARTDIFICN